MKSESGNWKFWGPKPVPFQLDNESFYLGSDVANYLKLFRGKLYSAFPKLKTKKTQPGQNREIYEQTNEDHHQHLAHEVVILNLADCEEIFATGGARFKNQTYKTEHIATYRKEPKKEKKPKGTPSSSTTDQQPQAAQHMDAVPCSTPVAHIQKSRKKIRSFPLINGESEEKILENAKQSDELVPIRLDMEIEGHKLRDSFVWNRNEKNLNINDFAKILCDDLELPATHFVPSIVQSIQTQLNEHPREAILEDCTDQRVTLKLNIHVANISLQDQIEWDMSEKQNTPEKFAAQLCRDLGLGGEFVTAISYSIRGQLAWHQKTLAYMENPPQVIKQPLRNPADTEQWSPSLETLTTEEMEKKIRDQDRNTRRRRRQVAF